MKTKRPRSFYVHFSSACNNMLLRTKTDVPMVYNRQRIKMKKIALIAVAFLMSVSVIQAQDAQKCPCLMDNDFDALYAVAEQNNFSFDFDVSDGVTAAVALAKVGIEAYNALPDAKYVLKVTAGGEIKYGKISSCQMALEKTYDLLRISGVQEVRIISEELTLNGSCRNRSYTPRDLNEVKKRRDGWSGGF